MKYIRWFDQIGSKDLSVVGGKNASLGEMITHLASYGIAIPFGFAVTAQAYWYYIQYNKLLEPMQSTLAQLTDIHDTAHVQKIGAQMRQLIMQAAMPDDVATEITSAYHDLSQRYHQKYCDVAVRSSATAEDLPTASFAGQQDSFLNVVGDQQLIEACKKGMASLFTDRAIVYRVDQGFDHFKVALSLGVQKMVRSDKAVSGVAFSLDTETGFKDVITIESSYGLGETIVKGLVTPDAFIVHKPTLEQGFKPIIKKQCGDKKVELVYGSGDGEATTVSVPVPLEKQQVFSLTDDEILTLASYVLTIERYYSQEKKVWSPMDIEWAQDGNDRKIYIVQARPETIYRGQEKHSITRYCLKPDTQESVKNILVTGLSIGQKMSSGVARVISDISEIDQVQHGDIIVTPMTDPDWVPVMKRAAGIITEQGGRTCHAAIVSRELGIPALVGAYDATKKIKNGTVITLDCSQGLHGFVYAGKIPFSIQEIDIKTVAKPPVPLFINIADPAGAFTASFLPVEGVGLARIEFIITTVIKIHPMALLYPERVTDAKTTDQIHTLTRAYSDKKDFFIRELAQGVGMIAAAFYPRPVIVRFSDFKSNEYRNLIGGVYFEPTEENPMLGFRGASRYYNDLYRPAFELELQAMHSVRTQMGLKNLKVMIPFVRSVQEAEKVIALMKAHNIERGVDGLELMMMCEIPSNVILLDQFTPLFDGFSIGSNDLTQLVLGIDRDSPLLAALFDERDPAVKQMMAMAIETAHKHNRSIGICGQAPSDYPEIAQFLIEQKIDYLSLNSDAVISFLQS